MKTLVSTLVVIAVAVSSTVAQSPSTPKGAQAPPAARSKGQAADYYPLKVGTKWHYELDAGTGQKVQLTSTIGGVDQVGGKELARLEVFANGQKLPATEHLASKEDGVYRVRMNNADVTPPICLIKYPLKTGQTWGGETTVVDQNGQSQKMKVDCSEGKAEEVQVPAGKYQTVPCTIVVTAGPAKFTNIFWFARDVGIVKQRSEIGPRTVTMELTKFEAVK